MNKILIIGTNPPCPRCKLLTNVVTAKVKDYEIDADVVHISYTDDEAKAFARSIGLETGTAKDVARKIGMLEYLESNSKKATNNLLIENAEYKEYNDSNWSYELDELLRPLQNKSKEAGVLMTPVLIINNEVKSQGGLPRVSKIDEWLIELKN